MLKSDVTEVGVRVQGDPANSWHGVKGGSTIPQRSLPSLVMALCGLVLCNGWCGGGGGGYCGSEWVGTV